jgi:hypothetical protein
VTQARNSGAKVNSEQDREQDAVIDRTGEPWRGERLIDQTSGEGPIAT